MCYNCGCGIPDGDMGNKDNITEESIKKAATASNQSVDEAKKNMLEELKKQISQKNG